MAKKPTLNMTWYRIVTREGEHCARVGDADPKRAFIQARIALSAVYRNRGINPAAFNTNPPFEIVEGQAVQWTVAAFFPGDDCKVTSYGPYATQAAASAQFHRARHNGAIRAALYQDHRRIARWTKDTDLAAAQLAEVVA